MRDQKELETDFRQTHYRAPALGIVLRIGERAPRLNAWAAARGFDTCLGITAWNPRAIRRGAELNAQANDALAADLSPFTAVGLVGEAFNGSWREDGFLAFGPERAEALRLARKYGQVAVVFCALPGAPELLFPLPGAK